jgi:hypothetical protein
MLNSRLNFLPRTSPVVAKILPNNLLDLLLTPTNIIKAGIIPREPNSPKRNTFQESPISTNLLKLTRRSLSKDGMFPVRHIPHRINSRGSLVFQKTIKNVWDAKEP